MSACCLTVALTQTSSIFALCSAETLMAGDPPNSPQAADDSLTQVFALAQERLFNTLVQYEVTRNPIFLWNVIAIITSQSIVGITIALPDVVREYLHAAALDVRAAAVERPEDFEQGVMKALQLTRGRQGSSVAREYAKQQSVVTFVGVYSTLKRRHTASKAELMIAEAMEIEVKSVSARLTEARKTLAAFHAKRGSNKQYIEATLSQHDDTPDAFLLTLVKGMPDVVWNKLGKSSRKLSPSRIKRQGAPKG